VKQYSASDNRLAFHHVGYVVQSIEATAPALAKSLDLDWDTHIYHDPLQQVRVSFFRPASRDDPMIELVEPIGDKSPVAGFLKRGGGLHHVCYEVICLEKQLDWVRGNHDLIVRAPQPAVAFGGRRIAWVYTRTKLLIEYLERPD
jgi:methylmalonyl-CoA/ethylmalonyl-CoA epimerase